MHKKNIIENISKMKNSKGLIIDDNKAWNHDKSLDRINKFIDGDLHEFYDIIADEQLFEVISDKYDYIFIGEIMHVITLQSLIFNLEKANNSLNEDGVLYISILENAEKHSDASQQKIITRLANFDLFTMKSQMNYYDENGEKWTLVELQIKARTEITEDNYQVSIAIGSEIATLANSSGNLKKIKKGVIKSKLSYSDEIFNNSFKSIEDNLRFYMIYEIDNLNPRLSSEFMNQLAEFVFNNRKAINSLSQENIQLLTASSFNMAYENFKANSLNINNEYISKYSMVIKKIWRTCLKTKLSKQLVEEIEGL